MAASKTRLYVLITLLFMIIVCQPAMASLVKFEFEGRISDSTENYTAGELFSGFYILDTDTHGIRGIDIYSTGDRITTYDYRNCVVDFEMVFEDKSIGFEPDGESDSSGSDSNIMLFNNQRFTSSYGGYFYGDRIITMFNDVVSGEDDINWVQFDWSEYSYSSMPDLLDSTNLPSSNFDFSNYKGRISSDSGTCSFMLTSLEATPVPIASSLWFLVSGLCLLTPKRSRSFFV